MFFLYSAHVLSVQISEREEHDTYGRALMFNAHLRAKLTPLGWQEIDLLAFTSAIGFSDTDRHDGMHQVVFLIPFR